MSGVHLVGKSKEGIRSQAGAPELQSGGARPPESPALQNTATQLGSPTPKHL